jgi:2-keto-4-pentenoate hydratase/2-oxohepta-3-ene-1,7-dioic acid hydratase in catechol pathway
VRLLRIGNVGEERPAVLSSEGKLIDCSQFGEDFNGQFFASDGLARLRAFVGHASLPELDPDEVRIGSPVAKPEKIVCVGLNYLDHALESKADVPAEPILFMKAPNTIIGPNDDIKVPIDSSRTDWELELAIVIGSRARYLNSPDDAPDFIAGYAISNDVSERDFQLNRGGQWTKGKSCETFNPLGPWLVTPDDIGDPQDLGLRLHVNGEIRQNGSTKNMIFNAAFVVWYISQFMVLEAGDVINTGTPAGVSAGNPSFAFLREGDLVESEIDDLGRQRNHVTQAQRLS